MSARPTFARIRRRLRRRLRARAGWRPEPWQRRAAWTVGILAALGAVWIVVTGVLAQRQADALRSQLQQVRSLVAAGRIAEARSAAERVPDMTDRLDRLSSGPAWWVGAHLPWAGRPLATVRATAAAADEVGSHAIPDLIVELAALDPNALRVNADTVNLTPLVKALPRLTDARASLRTAAHLVDDAPHSSWLGQVDTARRSFAVQLSAVSGYVDAAQRAAAVLPDMLGRTRTQRYFVGLQNEAEMRGTGGLPGAFAIATAERGTITFTEFHSDAVLFGNRPTGLKFGSGFDALYGASDPTSSFQDSNASPNFPYAAQIWARMWQRKSGQRIDGVVAVDPGALSYFLAATGPVVAQKKYLVSAQNVVSITQRDEYAAFSDNTERRAFLVDVLRATSTKLTSGGGRAVDVARAASRAGSQHRLMLWSAQPNVQRVLEQTDYAGALLARGHPFAGVVLNNAAAGKLDYYTHRSLTYSRTGCGSRRDTYVTVRITNSAPAGGLPPYVTTRLDNPPKGVKPGDNHLILDYYATSGSSAQSATVDGRIATVSQSRDLGLEVFRFDLQLPRGTTTTVVLHLREPAGKGGPVIWKQPGVTPLSVQEFNQSC